MASVVKHVETNNQAELDAALAGGAGQPIFVLFTDEAFSASKSPVTLITVPLVRDEYKGNAKHWARVHPGAKLQRIPTLMKWGTGRAVASLIEGQCTDAELVRELVLGDDA